MQLTYRGLTYDYRPPQVETSEALGLTGSYRGLDYRFRHTSAKNVMPPNANLTYRGVAFNPAQPLTPTDSDSVSFQERVRARLSQKTQAIKKRHQSLLLRLTAEMGSPNEAANHHEA
ncbi:MAG: hypothetical protein RLZZ568_1880 [Cyanobacteriota bacterium]|jgi:hypothetical protein